MSDDDKQKLLMLQPKLNEMYIKKAKGAYIRSKAKWIEEGERSTAYFCRLEKRHEERNSIKDLIISGNECTNPSLIANEIYLFYRNLYSSDYSSENCDF